MMSQKANSNSYLDGAGDQYVGDVVRHIFGSTVPARELDSAVLGSLRRRSHLRPRSPSLPRTARRNVLLAVGLIPVLILIAAAATLGGREPVRVSARTILLHAAQAMSPPTNRAGKRVYREQANCPPYGTCKRFTATIWATTIRGSRVEHGFETTSVKGHVVQHFRTIHGGLYGDWVRAGWSRRMSSIGHGEIGGAGPFWDYFIHGVDYPGVASGLTGAARRDGFIDLGSGTGYRFVGQRTFDRARTFTLKFTSPGYAYYAFFDERSFVLLGMQGPGFRVALSREISVPLCSVYSKEFAFFGNMHPHVPVCGGAPPGRHRSHQPAR